MLVCSARPRWRLWKQKKYSPEIYTIIALQYRGVLPNIIKHHIVLSDPLVDAHLRFFSTIVINCLGYQAASLRQFWHPLLLQQKKPLQVHYISTKRYDVQKKYGSTILVV